jgi:beta-lactamase class A
MVAILVLLLAATPASARSDAASQIAAIEARLGGRIGLAALDIGSGKRVDYRADERFPMCSTFKFLAAAAVLKRVDQRKRNWIGLCLTARKTFWNMRRSRKLILKKVA